MYLTEDMRRVHIQWDEVFTSLRHMKHSRKGVVCHATNILRTFCPPVDEQLVEKATVQLRSDLPNQYRASLGVMGGQTILSHGSEPYGLLDNYQLLALPVALYWWHQINEVVHLNNPGEGVKVTDALLPIALMSSYSHPASIHDTVRDFHMLGLSNSVHYGKVLSLDLDSGVPMLSVIAESFEQYFEQRTNLFLARIRQEQT